MDVKTLRDTPPWEWPEDAKETIHRLLLDHRADQSDRLLAAQLAGENVVIDDEMAGSLLAILGNSEEPERLRGRAAISLGPVLEMADTEELDGEFDDPDAVPVTEQTFHEIQDSLQELYRDEKTPKEVRRRILEASVRAPRDWHLDAIRAAYSSGDKDWMLTAVFGMGWIRGFDDQILEALESTDPDIHYEAVVAAGRQELDAAWPHVVALVEDRSTPKPLLLAAIEAVGQIRPREAGVVLIELYDSTNDKEIAEAADEAMQMAQAITSEGEDDDEDEDASEWVN
jgi:hypothetical protein